MRPEYETEEDRKRERKVADRIAAWGKCEVLKLPAKHALDYVMIRDHNIVGFAEIKCRTNLWDQYPSYMISLHKVMEANRIAEYTTIPSFLFVRWGDGNLGYLNFGKTPDRVAMGGRDDRGDPEDMEPVAYYDISDNFTMILDGV